MLFHGASAKEVSCIRCYSTKLFSARVAIILPLAINSEILNTWLWRMCTALIDHLWMVMGHFSSWANDEDLGKTPLSPQGNCRFDSSNATPKPQSQQMILLACTTASALLAFMSEYKPNEARGRLRVDIGNGSMLNGISDGFPREATALPGEWYRPVVLQSSWLLHHTSMIES